MSSRRLRLNGPAVDLPVCRCLECGAICNSGHNLGDEPAWEIEPGDCAICGTCGALMVYDEQLHLRHPTTEERAEIETSREFAQAARQVAARRAQWN